MILFSMRTSTHTRQSDYDFGVDDVDVASVYFDTALVMRFRQSQSKGCLIFFSSEKWERKKKDCTEPCDCIQTRELISARCCSHAELPYLFTSP
jgi:hypothetical protein